MREGRALEHEGTAAGFIDWVQVGGGRGSSGVGWARKEPIPRPRHPRDVTLRSRLPCRSQGRRRRNGPRLKQPFRIDEDVKGLTGERGGVVDCGLEGDGASGLEEGDEGGW